MDIIQHDWFLSDHKPISLNLSVPLVMPADALYKRSLDLNFDDMEPCPTLARFNGNYNYDKMGEFLFHCHDSIFQ